MNAIPFRSSLPWLAQVVMLAAILCAAGLAGAQEVKQVPAKSRDVTVGLMSERTHRDLSRAYDLIGEERYQEAEAALGVALGRSGLSDYERAIAVQLRGHVNMALERFDAALRDFEQVIQADALPNLQHFQLMFQVAQIYVMQEQFERGLQKLDEWFAYTDTITPAAYELQAAALSQLNRYREAIVAIDKAINLSNNPKETWYQLKVGMHFELKEYPQASRVLEILVTIDPNRKSYWTQLASSYLAATGSEAQQKENERKALSVMALAHRKGLLDRESEWVQLFQLYSADEIPFKAGQILEDGLGRNIIEPTLKRWEELGNAWYAAQELERALEAFGRAAALSSDGKIDLQRAYILVDQERWPEAEQALAEATRKGGLERGCNATLLLGMAQFEQGKRQAAQRSFNQSASDDRCRSAATQWLRHIEETRPRALPSEPTEEQVGPE